MGRTALFMLLLFTVVLFADCVSASSKDTQWLEHIRPAMLPVYMQKTKYHDNKPDPTKYFNRHLGILDVVRMFLNDHARELDPKMAEFYRELTENSGTPSGQVLTCENTDQCPPVAPADPMKSYRRAVNGLLTDPASCDPCIALIDNLRDRACTEPWEPFRDNIIDLCENILFPLIGLDPIMCNGTVTLQGPHIYCIIQEASSFEVCESLDACYPAVPATEAEAEKPPMALRVPPVVKKRLELKKALKKNKKQKRHQKKKVKRQTGRVRIIQLTDIHVQPEYAIGSPVDCKAASCCLDSSLPVDGTDYARKWGEYSCNLPERTLVKFLERINDFNPDFVIYAGDSPPHTLWDETLTSQLNVSNIVVNAMTNILTPGTRVYPAIGNHEMYPTNLYSKRLTDSEIMADSFTRMWHSLAGLDAPANATFADLSYFSVLHRPGLRVLSVNSNYDWYSTNFYNTLNKNDSYNAAHKQFVETTLADARAAGEKVVIVSHHPTSNAIVRTARWWHDVMVQYGDVVALHVSGHTHQDEFHVSLDPLTDEAKSVNLVAPSLTTNTNINPSMRVFELDDTTFDLVDYQSYFFELDLQNPETDPDIVLNYDPREDYNMTDLSPSGWLDLSLRFLDEEGLFQLWYANQHAMADVGPCVLDSTCGESCKKSSICGIWYSAADEQNECVANWDNLTLPLVGAYAVRGDASYSGVTMVMTVIVTLATALFVM